MWLTPPQILTVLGEFDLDPCAAPDPRPWNTAKHHISLPEDGLRSEWYGRVWLNPPYDKQIEIWLEKLANHGNGIALIFARTETAAWKKQIWGRADGIRFIFGRPNFYFPDGSRAAGNSGGPLALIAYGQPNVESMNQVDGVTVSWK